MGFKPILLLKFVRFIFNVVGVTVMGLLSSDIADHIDAVVMWAISENIVFFGN